MAVMLEARALGYGYPGRPVGRGLDLSLGAGEVLCVLRSEEHTSELQSQ